MGWLNRSLVYVLYTKKVFIPSCPLNWSIGKTSDCRRYFFSSNTTDFPNVFYKLKEQFENHAPVYAIEFLFHIKIFILFANVFLLPVLLNKFFRKVFNLRN